MQINWEEQLGSETDHCNPGFQGQENKVSEPLAVEIVGVAVMGETSSLTEESIGEAQGSLERIQAHPQGNLYQKAAICLWEVREVTESRARAKQVALFPL